MSEVIKLRIDGKEIEAKPGTSVLHAALGAGIYIPHLCDHPDLRPVGGCRLCLVEIKDVNGFPASCTTPVSEGMEVQSKTESILNLRRLALELLLADHPEECSTCTKYLNCELQSLKQYLGISEHLSVRRRPKFIPPDTSHPLFDYDFARCVNCSRCVRACNELRGAEVLSFVKWGEENSAGIAVGTTWEEAGCRYCGACVEVCPTGAIMDKPELVKGKRRRDALVPCRANCPAEIDTARYVRFLGEGKYSESAAVIREKVPLPLVLGYICSHPCEGACRRALVNSPISLRNLKRFAIEHDTQEIWRKNARHESSTGKRVAVVGSGPAGLTVAYYLAKVGHEVIIFEALPEAGGMLRYGIPEYRLPRNIIAREVEEVLNLGVEIRTNTRVESLESLIDDDDFDAVVVAVGAHKGSKLPIPGNDLKGILDAISFLRNVHLGTPDKLGKRLLVVGGGNVAFDCARVARRLGVEEIHVACLEPRDGMLASPEEIDEAVEEGIVIHASKGFTRVVGENGVVGGLECRDVSSFSFDEEGKLQVEYVSGSEHIIPADSLIFAIGQKPEILEDFDLDTTSRGLVEVDEYSLETNLDGVFAAGDAVFGTTSVIKAIASARKTASAVDKFLGGNGNIDEALAPAVEWNPYIGKANGSAAESRQELVRIAPAERVNNFCAVECGFDETAALTEAARCLNCNLRMQITPVRFWGDY